MEKTSITTIIFILLFSVANRYFEILKWQNLVDFIKPISVSEASKQVLGALTAGIFTPNDLGEYAGKAMFFKKEQTKKVVFLNLICNGIQMILTIIFGTIGLILIGYWFYINYRSIHYCYLKMDLLKPHPQENHNYVNQCFLPRN